MSALVILLTLGVYQPELWQVYPSMDQVRCLSFSTNRLFVAVPRGVYLLDRFSYSYVRCLNQADGLAGDVMLCAWNPGRSNLLITTPDHLYEYSPVSDQVTELFPPFTLIHSVGIAPDGAYFDTDQGLFRKHRVAPEFNPVQNLPRTITWYGDRDTSRPQDHVVLNPYFVSDEYLNSYPLSRVRADPVRRKLFATAEGYGLLVFDLRTGAREAHVRLGPGAHPRNFIRLAQTLWFLSPDHSAALDRLGRWNYYLTRPGDLPHPGLPLLAGAITDLARRERLLSVLPDSAPQSLDSLHHRSFLLGTDYGLYRLDDRNRLVSLLKLNRPVYALARLKDSVLVGTGQGLFLLAHDSLLDIADPFGRSDWGVFDMVQSSTGLFLANLGGITMRAGDGTWLRLVPPGFDLSQPVQALATGGDFLFAGTATGLLAYNTKDQSWTAIDSRMGLPSSNIIGLSADDQYLWIASPDLLARFDYSKGLPAYSRPRE
jgi:hypothetical protein